MKQTTFLLSKIIAVQVQQIFTPENYLLVFVYSDRSINWLIGSMGALIVLADILQQL